MSDEVKPALTAEEWVGHPRYNGTEYHITGVTVELLDGNSRLAVNGDEYSWENQSRHALAALALHGQPFGFSREDVRNLGLLADDLRDFDRYAYDHLKSLIARIRALLPPEAP